MKLSDCRHGLIVETIPQKGEESEIGMIVGIANNIPGADRGQRKGKGFAVPLVQFSSDLAPRRINAGNIKISKYY